MAKHLLRSLVFVILLSSCVAASHNRTATDTGNNYHINHTAPITSSFEDVDTSFIIKDSFGVDIAPVSLTELPRTEERAFVLAPGFYETDFKTYCLQPGTPAPSENDVYFQAPLKGSRKEVIETILRNSQKETQLEQKNIQLLLWSVVSRSDFKKLSPEVQATAMQLLTPKQVFELSGGMLGVAKTAAGMLPASGGANTLQQLFDLGITTYEAYERLAVVSGPSETKRTSFKRNQWYKHKDGYYVRYFPNGYQQTKIQVYVPSSTMDTAAHESANDMIFDPTSMVVVPANSNAQRLGVGGPVKDIVRAVFRTIGSEKSKGKAPSKETKDVKHPPMKN